MTNIQANLTHDISAKVEEAFQQTKNLAICAGNTKQFYGRVVEAESLCLSAHSGIIEYEPSELYITARSGTPLSEIENTIQAEKQMIPCEPPYFGANATLGGMVACGLSGPRRASAGAIRDCILGTEIINGKGEYLKFGGKVMKNVAGYDVSRLMCGAMGTLGILMSITLRLVPKPETEQTIVFSLTTEDAIHNMNTWANTSMPISANYYDGQDLYLRLSGSSSAVNTCIETIGGENIADSDVFWSNVKEQQTDFFNTDYPIWRISVAPNIAPLDISGAYVMEWNGGLRWYASQENANSIREKVEHVGGHATLFRQAPTNDSIVETVFHPLPLASLNLHQKLKQVFDPARILNPGKMYAGL